MRPFIKKISEFMVAISIAASAALVVLGCLIIVRPELISTVIAYGVGIACILLGLACTLSVIRSTIENSLQKNE